MSIPSSLRSRSAVAGVFALALLAANAGAAAAVIHPGSYTTGFKTVAVAAGVAGAATASCPSGKLAVTGGAYWHRSGANGDATLPVELRGSTPTSDGVSWYASGKNNATETLYLTTVVQCLPKTSTGTYTAKIREVVVDPSRPGNADLRCNAGQKVVSGGGLWHAAGQPPKAGLIGRLIGSVPDSDGNGWTVIGRNDGASILNMRVIVLCAPAGIFGSGATTDVFFDTKLLGETGDHYLSCPAGTRVIGGGFYFTHQSYSAGIMNFDTSNTIISSSVTGYGTAWYAAAKATDSHESFTFWVWYVRCLAA